MMKTFLYGMISFLFTFVVMVSGVMASEDDPKPSIELGAKVFADRCVLCHGSDGMGEGRLPMKLKEYPRTNLAKDIKAKSRKEIYEAVVYGGTTSNLSNYMPPMGNELKWTELESVVDYVLLIRNNPADAVRLRLALTPSVSASRKVGREIFESRCVLCHGPDGEGDGRLAKVIKTPPPANLQISRLPDENLVDIIKRGGAAVGRSPQMPPWGKQFNDSELNSIVLFVKSLRQ